jgi:hypothetical protein
VRDSQVVSWELVFTFWHRLKQRSLNLWHGPRGETSRADAVGWSACHPERQYFAIRLQHFFGETLCFLVHPEC